MRLHSRLALVTLAMAPLTLVVTSEAASAHQVATSGPNHIVATKHDTTAEDDCDPNDNGKFEGFFGFFKQDASEDCHPHRHHHND